MNYEGVLALFLINELVVLRCFVAVAVTGT